MFKLSTSLPNELAQLFSNLLKNQKYKCKSCTFLQALETFQHSYVLHLSKGACVKTTNNMYYIHLRNVKRNWDQ